MIYEDIARSVFQMRNFFDELTIFDTDCICRYCEIINPDAYSFTADEVIGKHLFEIFPSSNAENSEVYSVVTVSYTHLDVYKRQTQGFRQIVQAGIQLWLFRFILCQQPRRLFVDIFVGSSHQNPDPVSYTHLDHYLYWH